MLTHLWKLTHEYRKTAGGLSPICKGILAQSFSCKKLSNQKHTANTVRNTGRTTLCWIRGKVKEFLFIKLTSYLSLSFRNLSQQGKFYYLRKTLKSRRRFPFWGEIKPSTPVLLSIFRLHWKSFYLVIYSRFLDLTSHLHGKFATWG